MEKETLELSITPEEWADAENRGKHIFWIKVKAVLLIMGALALYVTLTSFVLKLAGISDLWIAVIEAFSFAVIIIALWRVKIDIKLPGGSVTTESKEESVPQKEIKSAVTISTSKSAKKSIEKGSTEIAV